MGFAIGVFENTCVGVDGQSGQVILVDVFVLYGFLNVGHEGNVLLIADRFMDEVVKELEVYFYHFEIDDLEPQQLHVEAFQLLNLGYDGDAGSDDRDCLGSCLRNLLVEGAVAGADLEYEFVEKLGIDVL